MTKKTNIPVIAILLIIILISLSLNQSSFRPLRLQIVRPGYFHFWHFKAVTEDEYVEGPSYTVDETNFPVSSNLNEIVEESKYSAIAYITKELVDRFAEKGYTVTVNSVYPTVRIEQRTEYQQFRDYTKITKYSTLIVDCDVEFETDKPLAESPLPAWVLVLCLAIIDKLPAIIVGVIVGLGIYVAVNTWVNSMFVEESILEVEYYDEEGNLTKRETTTERTPATEGFLWSMIVPVVIVIVAAFVFIKFMGGKKG